MSMIREKFDLQSLLPTEVEPVKEIKKRIYPRMDCFHNEFSPIDECRANLQKLADYLLALPKNYKEFDMSIWYGDSDYADDGLEKETNPVCGTAACAAGHGPAAGIAPLSNETWCEYAERLACNNSSAESFFFSGFWDSYDNTPQGAAKRIEYALQHGVPDEILSNKIVEHLRKVEV